MTAECAGAALGRAIALRAHQRLVDMFGGTSGGAGLFWHQAAQNSAEPIAEAGVGSFNVLRPPFLLIAQGRDRYGQKCKVARIPKGC